VVLKFICRADSGRGESLKFAVTLVAAFAEMVVYLDSIENYIVSLIAEVLNPLCCFCISLICSGTTLTKAEAVL